MFMKNEKQEACDPVNRSSRSISILSATSLFLNMKVIQASSKKKCSTVKMCNGTYS